MQENRTGTIRFKANELEIKFAKQLAGAHGMRVSDWGRYILHKEAERAGLVPAAGEQQHKEKGHDQ